MLKKQGLKAMARIIELVAQRAYLADEVPEDKQIIENISYDADGIDEHKLDIIYPNVEMEQYPFIINIHGGGFSMNSKDKIYRNYGMRLAENQFAVVNINFRLSIHAAYPSQMEDVLAVLRFIAKNAKQYHLDMNRMFLAGDSSGAYMASMAGCILTNPVLKEIYHWDQNMKVRAIASNCGMYDFKTFMEDDVTFPMKQEIVQILFGTDDYEKAESFTYSSVLDYITEDFPPIYVMDTEQQSFANEALRLEKILKEKNVSYQLHIFEKKEKLMHAFNVMSKYEQSKIVLEEIFTFFGEQLSEL